MKKVFRNILPTSKESVAAKLRRNNAPATVDTDQRGQVAAADITDSEDDGRSSGDERPSRAGKGGGGGGGSSGGPHHGVARAESFEERMQNSHYERRATAGAGRGGMAAEADGSSSDGGVPRGQVVAQPARGPRVRQ